MARKSQRRIEARDVQGLKFFDKLAPLLGRLHDVGTERDRAHNRTLHCDQYCLLVLLYLFSPLVTSMRALQQASELEVVQKKLGVSRTSLGSFSEATDVFDPERLREIVRELGAELQPLGRDPRLKDVQHILTAVDGTLIKTLARIVEAACSKSRSTGKPKAAWRLHTQFEVDRYVPVRIDVTGGSAKGEQDERVVLGKQLEAGRCYLMDRGYAKFALFNRIHTVGSSYVCRIRDNSRYTIVEELPLDDAARTAGVVLDAIVEMGQGRSGDDRPQHRLRLVIVKTTPHKGHGEERGHDSDGFLRILTNLVEVPADVIATIYRYRWTIEVFFRFFKHVLGCRHLLSTDPRGIEIQAYCAIIACLLITLWTGRKPTKRTYEMICFYLIGWASEEELLRHIEKLKAQS
jgi:DDE family transposase